MIVAVGHSEDIDSADAIQEVLQQCKERLNGKIPQAAVLYAGIDHDFQHVLDAVNERYPGIPLIGCTTHGELSTTGFAEDSIVLMLLQSERVRFSTGVAENASRDTPGATRRSLEAARAGLDEPERLCIVVPSGIGINMKAILEALDVKAPVCGGLAGDRIRLEKTYQFCNRAVYSDAVVILLATGPIRVSTGVASGWQPLGGDHHVTRSTGLVIQEIDGRPAQEIWQHYFGTTHLSSRHLIAVFPDTGEEFYLTAPAYFKDDGSMALINTPISEGARVRFADASREQILSGTGSSIDLALSSFPAPPPEAALVFSCAGRHMTLGTRIKLEHEVLRDRLGPDVPLAGFYSYGEICPLPSSPSPYAHGGTFVTVLIGES